MAAGGAGYLRLLRRICMQQKYISAKSCVQENYRKEMLSSATLLLFIGLVWIFVPNKLRHRDLGLTSRICATLFSGLSGVTRSRRKMAAAVSPNTALMYLGHRTLSVTFVTAFNAKEKIIPTGESRRLQN